MESRAREGLPSMLHKIFSYHHRYKTGVWGHWSAEKVELQRIRGMTLSFLSTPVSIPQLIYRSCTISHYLSMSQEGGKTTAAFFDSVSVARALSTIIQDLFKSGLKSVHKWTEDLSLSLLSLHLWPGKMTSVSKSMAQT